jgi:hypothetical protein
MINYGDDDGIDFTNRNEIKSNSDLMNVVTSAWYE